LLFFAHFQLLLLMAIFSNIFTGVPAAAAPSLFPLKQPAVARRPRNTSFTPAALLSAELTYFWQLWRVLNISLMIYFAPLFCQDFRLFGDQSLLSSSIAQFERMKTLGSAEEIGR
jgi:hypothetical protein